MVRPKDGSRETSGGARPPEGALARMRRAYRGIFGRPACTDGISSPSLSGQVPGVPGSDIDQVAGQILARLLPACGA